MDPLDLEIDYYKNRLTELILPATLMDCFEVFRRGALRKAAQAFNEKELGWLLLTMNEFRGADDRKEGFDLLFDPLMYTVDHPGWSAPPGTLIELPVLNSGLYERAGRGTRFRAIADSELTALSVLTDGYPDEAVIGLAEMAAAALADSGVRNQNRKSAISYLALNASALIEDYWAEDDSIWRNAGSRLVAIPDVVADLKAVMIRNGRGEEAILESDLTCYTEDGRAELREGVLALMVECDGCGYLRIGPALNALEAEAPGLGAAFYNLFRFSLYRWMRTYDHADAEQYNETLREWAAQDGEANQSAYEFPDVEGSIPAFVRLSPELDVRTLRGLLSQHKDGRYGAWVRSLLKLHALCRFRAQVPREIFEDVWDDQPLPVLLVTFQDRDGIAACFEAESQSMYEASHEPAFCAVFSPDKAEEVVAALLSFRRFLAINLELFTLVEALNQHEEAPHEDPHIDRQTERKPASTPTVPLA